MTYDLDMSNTRVTEKVTIRSEVTQEFILPVPPLPVPVMVIANAIFGPVKPLVGMIDAMFSFF